MPTALPTLRIHHHRHDLSTLGPESRSTLSRALLTEARLRHHHRDAEALARSLFGPPGARGEAHVLAAGPVPLAWLVSREVGLQLGVRRTAALAVEPGMRPGARQHARLARILAREAAAARLRGVRWLAVRATWPEALAWARHLLPGGWPRSDAEPSAAGWAVRDALVHGLGVLAPLAGRSFVCAAPARVERPGDGAGPAAADFRALTASARGEPAVGGAGVLVVAPLTWRAVARLWWAAVSPQPLDPPRVDAPASRGRARRDRGRIAEAEPAPVRMHLG